MRLSRRSEYGLRALTDLVRHDGSGPIALATLAERNRLPPKFLEQIMSTLRHAGIVRTTLGRTAAMPSARTRRRSRWGGSSASSTAPSPRSAA